MGRGAAMGARYALSVSFDGDLAAPLLGVDLGARRIGLAVSQGRTAVPLTIVEHENRERDLERVAAIARERLVAAVVLGLPVLESGEEGEQARRTRRFGDALARRLDAPVVYQDERYSSVRADNAMADAAAERGRPARRGGGRHIDDAAAAVILQAYLDAGADGSDTLRRGTR
jgi:putative Holliday junction resolvase